MLAYTGMLTVWAASAASQILTNGGVQELVQERERLKAADTLQAEGNERIKTLQTRLTEVQEAMKKVCLFCHFVHA